MPKNVAYLIERVPCIWGIYVVYVNIRAESLLQWPALRKRVDGKKKKNNNSMQVAAVTASHSIKQGT